MSPMMAKRPKRARDIGEVRTLGIEINPKLRKALDTFIENNRPRSTLREHVEIALERYLAEHGVWPAENEAE